MGHKLNGVFISETTALSCAGSAFGPSTWITALVPPPPPRDALASSPPPRDHRLRGGRGASPTSASASGASHLPDSNARCNDFLRSSSTSPALDQLRDGSDGECVDCVAAEAQRRGGRCGRGGERADEAGE